MSFSTDVKNELCQIRVDTAAELAECHGMLMLCRAFCFDKILLHTGVFAVAEHFSALIRRSFGVITHIKKGGDKRPTYTVAVTSEADRKRILHMLGYRRDYEIGVSLSRLKSEGNIKAFIRGAFLSGATLCDPEKEYRCEFSFKNNDTAADFLTLLDSQGLSFTMTFRAGKFLVYTKNSNTMEDLLTFLGAGGETLNLIGIKVYKSVRNKVNRKNNIETSNIIKTSNAAFIQNNAIAKIKESGKLDLLPEELYEAAMLRLNNPDLSLSALCKLSKTPITRSGLNHRIQKLIELANDIK